MEIVNMGMLNKEQLEQAAWILTDSLPLGWSGFDDAMEEIRECLVPENVLLAVADNGIVVGWGGIIREYNGNAYELHPLAVREDMRGKGIGRMIVKALEDAARNLGALTIFLGADDEKEMGETSLANVDLYEDLPSKIAEFNAGTHQSGFYVKLGYKVTGVVPDANGLGKPDIILCKKLY